VKPRIVLFLLTLKVLSYGRVQAYDELAITLEDYNEAIRQNPGNTEWYRQHSATRGRWRKSPEGVHEHPTDG
jgi:hypothetical protein